MVALEGIEHGAVGIGAEDTVDDHVETVREGVAGYRGDEADVRRARDVMLAQYGPAQVVLADQGDAPAIPGPYLRRDETLAGPGVASQPDPELPRKTISRVDREPATTVPTLTATAAVSPGARCALRRRKNVELREQRLQELMQPGKSQMRLRLQTLGGQYAHAAGCRVPADLRHQRRLSDASLAAHDDSTAALTRMVDKVVQNA